MNLVPQPRSVEEASGRLDLRQGVVFKAEAGLEGAASLGQAWLSEALSLGGQSSGLRAAGAISGGVSGSSVPGGLPIELRLDQSLPEEDYSLVVRSDGAAVHSGGYGGAVQAVRVLRQIALSEGPLLPACRIEDGPRFSWRGAMLDCARNFFRVEFVERFIDLMALHGLNRFHWHLTDDQAWRLEIAGHPEICERGAYRQDGRYVEKRLRGGFYTRGDVGRVVEYAARRGIVVVPEIESPGHAVALLASHPELSCASASSSVPGGPSFLPEDHYGVFEDILCAGSDEVFDLLGSIYDEASSLFPGPWLHAGGDEAPKSRWSACPRCSARMEREGIRSDDKALDLERLQAWFMNRVADMLASRGKAMIGWDEILDGGVRKDAIIMSWRGKEGGIAAAKAGYRAIMSPQTKACYLDHKQIDSPEEPGNIGVCTLEDSYSFDPVPPELSSEEGQLILGGQANIWTEYLYFGKQVEYMAFPRLCALAEVFWCPRESRDFDSFLKRMEAHARRLDLLGVNYCRRKH